jgi:tripartite-type tricarboxylate transporter receptor subunit TctC
MTHSTTVNAADLACQPLSKLQQRRGGLARKALPPRGGLCKGTVMSHSLRQGLHLAAVAAALLALSNMSGAQTYPSRPITIVVPFPSGGAATTLARLVAEHMRGPLGQPVIVENIAGAGGTLGVGRVARAAPDGHTLSLGNWASHVGAGAVYPMGFDLLNDLDPIARFANTPLWIVARKTLPASDLRELITWLKANPDKASAATVGAGSAPHLCALYLQSKTGVRFQIVPYRGGAPAIQDLVGGQVDFMCDMAGNSLPQVRSGAIKALAVMAETRWFAAPDSPTVDEMGVGGLHVAIWHGLWAPKGTPKDIIAKLNAAVVGALAEPTVRQRFEDQGQEIPPRDQQSPEALAAYHRAEIEKWWPMIKAAGIKPE